MEWAKDKRRSSGSCQVGCCLVIGLFVVSVSDSAAAGGSPQSATCWRGDGPEKPDTPIGQMEDICRLSQLQTESNRSLQVVQRTGLQDACELSPKGGTNTTACCHIPAGLQLMKSSPDGLSPMKKSITKVSENSAGTALDDVMNPHGVHPVVSYAPAFDLEVDGPAYREVMIADGEGWYDYLANATSLNILKLQPKILSRHVRSTESQLPEAAASYERLHNGWNFSMHDVVNLSVSVLGRVRVFPAKGLAKDRPVVICSGGSVGLLPSQAKLFLLGAIKEGADYVSCSLQVSKDGVLFCLGNMQISKFTNVGDIPEFDLRARTRNLGQASGAANDWFAFDFLWEEIKTLKVIPNTEGDNVVTNSPRTKLFYNGLPAVSFEEVIDITQNASRDVGLHVVMDNPMYLIGKGSEKLDTWIDQIDMLLSTLRRRRYLSSTNIYDESRSPLVISSGDSRGLSRLHTESNGSLWLAYRKGVDDACMPESPYQPSVRPWWRPRHLLDTGLRYIKLYQVKESRLKININSAGTPPDGVIDPYGVQPFRDDVVTGDEVYYYNFVSDPQFNSTAASYLGYLESSSRPLLRPKQKRWGRRGLLESEYEGAARAAWMAVGFATFAVAFLMVLLAWFVFRKIRDTRDNRIFLNEIRSFPNIPMLQVFSHAELVAATDNFSEANRLGKGGFGTVYKGELPDGRSVAVKKLHVGRGPRRSLRNDTAVQQLMNEVNIIGSVQHRNVVPLEGLCADKEFLLVYAYMPHGSLQDALFEPTYGIQLDWKQCCNIAVGTAKGVAYLHEECEHKIIHRDIKPANILLGDRLSPRLADFGLARNMRVDETHVTSRPMGSIGYIAPEYVTSGQLSEKSDAYSYGVLLLTIITGQRPTSKGRDEGEDMSTVEWVKKKASAGEDELLRVVDPRFEGNFDPSEAVRFLSTALLCVQNGPATRPAMSDVVQMLLGKTEIPAFSNARDPQEFFVDLDASFLWDTDSASMKVNATFGTCSTPTTTNGNDTNNIIIHTGIQEHRAILEDLS